MTFLDWIKLGLIKSDATAERFAADLIGCWHADKIPGELHEVLGLSPREYQAWTTGGVSLLTIAQWQRTSHPPLDVSKPWFKVDEYKHLEHRPASYYQQLFLKGRKIRAEILYRLTIGDEPRTPEQVAEDYDLPLQAVQEAIHYCVHHPDVLRQDHDREGAKIR